MRAISLLYKIKRLLHQLGKFSRQLAVHELQDQQVYQASLLGSDAMNLS